MHSAPTSTASECWWLAMASRRRPPYGRAIASDSTFWFAYFRYGHPMGWHEEPDSATKAAYWNHRHLLPERERLLVEASQLDSGLVWQWRRLEELVQRYPDYSPGWWLLGDQLLHVFPHVGATPMEARDAFERVVTLTPGMVGGWEISRGRPPALATPVRSCARSMRWND